MNQPVTVTAHVVRILHGALVVGLVVVGGTFLFLVRVAPGTPLGGMPDVDLPIAAIAFGLVAVAALVLRRRIPERRFYQSPDDYWAAVQTRGAAILLWAVVDGAGLVAWIGYLLTGRVAPAAVAALAILTLFMFRPSRLESEGTT